MIRVRLLHIVIFAAALSFGVRLGGLVSGIGDGAGPDMKAAYAKQEKGGGDEDGAGHDKKREEQERHAKDNQEGHGEEKAHGNESGEAEGKEGKGGHASAPDGAGKDIEWRDSLDSDIEYSAVQMKLFDDLSRRRKDVETKERQLTMREALLDAAEQELEQKYKELERLRQEIEGLLEKQSEEEDARLVSLVKIYEGMKAKDAARIFNTLDMDVLLAVLSRMSERKSAPIIAAMTPERAQSVTILLAEQKKLSSLPGAAGFR